MTSKKICVAILLLINFAFIGCTSKSAKPKNTLVIAISSIPTTLDPRFALDSEGMKIGSLIFQSLVKIGPDMNIEGDAAETWTLKPKQQNGKKLYDLDFSLKPNLYFHDGQKVTCSDILFSIQEYQADVSPFKSAFSNIIQKQCLANTLTLTFDTYSEKVLNSDLPVIKILPKAKAEFNPEFKNNLMGSGPFKIVTLKETEILLTTNPHYSDLPKIPFLQFKVIKDDFTRFLKMYKGDLDLAISSLPKNKIKSLEKADHLKIIRNPGLSMAYLLLNLKNPELANLANRKMLFSGIDRNEIIKYKLEGLAQPATSLLPPANPYFWPNFLSNKFLNQNSSDKLLAQDSAVLRQQVLNSSISQKILSLKTSNTREAVENAKLIAAQLRKLGFRINHESYEWGTYYQDIKQGEYDLATMTWVGAYDPDIYRIALASREVPPDGRNRGYYSNPEFDHLTTLGMNELDLHRRKEIYYQVQRIAYEDLAVIPLWYEDTITVLDKRIKNYVPSLNGDYSGVIKASLESN